MPQAGLMALGALRSAGAIRAGQKVLINGAGGGVGTFAVDPHEKEVREVPGRAQLMETIRQLKNLGYSPRQILEMAGEILGEEEK